MTPPLITVLLSIAGITVVWWSIPAFAPPTLPFGVRVPPARISDPDVAFARHTFSSRILGLAVAATVLTLPLTLVSSLELSLPIATGALVVADTTAYVLAHRRLRAAKAEGAWYASYRQGVTADLSLRRDPVRVDWHWLIPALAVAAATTITGLSVAADLPSTLPALDGVDLGDGDRVANTTWTAFNPVLIQVGSCLATGVAAVGLTRTRPALDAARPAASARRYRRYLRATVRLLFVTTALANATMLGIALRLWELVPAATVTTVVIFTPLAAILVAVVTFQLRVGHAGHRLAPEPGEETEDSGLVQRDDDRYWRLGGFVYLNADDPAIFVHQRGGGTWTVNLGHRAGQAIVTVLFIATATLAILSGIGSIDLPEK